MHEHIFNSEIGFIQDWKLKPDRQLAHEKQSIKEQQLPHDKQVPHKVQQLGILHKE